jgi:predicted dehydrogenase
MGNRIGIGIVGCGNVARIHAEAIRRVPDLSLVSACSRSAESARRFGKENGVPYYTNLADFLADPKLEAVAVCTPSGTHAEVGCAAAQEGKHVLVEKPIDITVEKADALIDTCRFADVRLGVAFQSRFLDATCLLESAVRQGRLGRPVLASAYVKWYRDEAYYASAAWRGTLHMDGGGALINQAIHTLDLLAWIMGPVTRITALSDRLLHPQIEAEDTLVATLRFQNGALGVIEAATSVYPGFKRRLEITGTEGTVVLEGDNLSVWALRDKSPNPLPAGTEISDGSGNAMAISCEGHRRVMEDFAEAIRYGRSPRVDGRSGRTSLELVRALYESARQQGTPVPL